MEIINQKEYLKKYLSMGSELGKKKKRKKSKKSNLGDRITIIDDDEDVFRLATAEEEEELLCGGEDAPQIVGIVDDRPLELKIDDYKSDKWKAIGLEAESNAVLKTDAPKVSITLNKPKDVKLQISEGGLRRIRYEIGHPLTKSKTNSGALKSEKSKDISPKRKPKEDDDYSPPRRRATDSPLGRNNFKNTKREDLSPPRKHREDDSSPPRKNRRYNDLSPVRKGRKNEDFSPPRRQQDLNKSRSRKNEDCSPPRRFRRSASPPRRSRKHSPVRRERRDNRSPRRSNSPPPKLQKMEKTLDGKRAGLQNAQQLIEETQKFNKKEEEVFKSLPAELLGKDAATIVRNRKTGKIRDPQKEAEAQLEKQQKDAEMQEKYSRWGRGLKQVQDYSEKLAEDLHEMNKPLARYADDEDLDKYLREQERDGDPMLAYIRKKKKKHIIETGKPVKPQFEGEYMPNRFGIRPGYRWDGVDRSSGYEAKWHEVQNNAKAMQDEVYKWSIEDM